MAIDKGNYLHEYSNNKILVFGVLLQIERKWFLNGWRSEVRSPKTEESVNLKYGPII